MIIYTLDKYFMLKISLFSWLIILVILYSQQSIYFAQLILITKFHQFAVCRQTLGWCSPLPYVRMQISLAEAELGRTSTLKLDKDCHLHRPSQLLMSMQLPHQFYSRGCQSQHTPCYGRATHSYLEIGNIKLSPHSIRPLDLYFIIILQAIWLVELCVCT